jgi:hypothetical protein
MSRASGDVRAFLEGDEAARTAFKLHSFDARAAWRSYFASDPKRFRTVAAWQRHRVRFMRFHRETAAMLKLLDRAADTNWCETPPSPHDTTTQNTTTVTTQCGGEQHREANHRTGYGNDDDNDDENNNRDYDGYDDNCRDCCYYDYDEDADEEGDAV